jgi:hypothetical protein
MLKKADSLLDGGASAKIMLQHLGEPMPGSDELDTEAKRQGKKKASE